MTPSSSAVLGDLLKTHTYQDALSIWATTTVAGDIHSHCSGTPCLSTEKYNLYVGKIAAEPLTPPKQRYCLTEPFCSPSIHWSICPPLQRDLFMRPVEFFAKFPDITLQLVKYQGTDVFGVVYDQAKSMIVHQTAMSSLLQVVPHVMYLDKFSRFGLFEYPKQLPVIKAPALYIGGRNNYFHFVTDFLPNLVALRMLPDLLQMPMVFWSVSRYIAEFLDILGFGTKNTIVLDDLYKEGPGFYKFSDITMASPVPLPVGLAMVRDTFRNPNAKSPARIYIGRKQGQSVRSIRMINQNEVSRVLELLGFQTVFLENISVLEQINLFSNAKLIISQHGAGLTNCVFAPPKAVIVELMSDSTESISSATDCYFKMTACLGQYYHRIVSYAVEKPPTQSPQDHPFHCNIDSLLRVIEPYLS
ncbi:MAG: glycosyltransferase 61 family protein [Verrucomicrobiota bacterium]|nr:glycosyltransferase 61 family protein [Verrucomicrobiota bacterium]